MAFSGYEAPVVNLERRTPPRTVASRRSGCLLIGSARIGTEGGAKVDSATEKGRDAMMAVTLWAL